MLCVKGEHGAFRKMTFVQSGGVHLEWRGLDIEEAIGQGSDLEEH